MGVQWGAWDVLPKSLLPELIICVIIIIILFIYFY